MFRIGEFSKLTQVSVRMLRHYDEVGLLKPSEVDRFTGYRLYRAEQIPQLDRIKFLRDLGFIIAEIAAALSDWDDSRIMELLERKRRETEDSIQAGRDMLSRIEQAKSDIQRDKIGINYSVSIKAIPACHVLSLRRVAADYYAEGALWKEMSAFAERNNLSISGNTFTIYHDQEYKERDVDMEICSPTEDALPDKEGFTFRTVEPVASMACSMVYGSFENIAGAFLSVANWLSEHNNFRIGSHSRQIVHRGPWNEEDPENYLTEIQIPLLTLT